MKKSISVIAIGVTASVGMIYWTWRKSQQMIAVSPNISTEQSQRILERAAPLLRLPTSPEQPPEVLADNAGLRCPVTGRVYPYHDGVLHLLDEVQPKTVTQRTLDTPFTAWVYDRFRETLTRALNSPDFAVEVAEAQRKLQVQSGDVLLDLACGQGNFTVEWAKCAGAEGLVIGLDYSLAMLARATHHINRWGLENVLLIHGDANALPFSDAALHKVNCSGGFHQFPDLPRALSEIARVSAPGAAFATSTFAEGADDPRTDLKHWFKRAFALHFVPLVELGEQLTALGYVDYTWSLPGGGWFGYASACKK
ncbi:MAG: methyltransferase domain-containing protein [Anaerolineae bacterium]|nr:methyltransferase domain-containing protein [Anaerolineae bacterium]